MNIFGIGPTELVLVLLIMLMVAGPKRMARWAYVMGVYAGKLRDMWSETSEVLKKELAEAGIEPEMVDSFGKMANPKTRRTAVSGQLDKLVGDMKKPIEESLKPVEDALKPVDTTLRDVGPTPLAPAAPRPASTVEQPEPNKDTASDDNSTGQYDAWTAS
ncbi:MAG: hypothetical protein JXN59_10720 [Anaerolineae bacterium]|nr:hypothetical protein [Anaerolineae bacterium]